MQSEMKEALQKTRGYLDYIEKHYDNVQRAWAEIKKKCFDMWFVSEDDYRQVLDAQVLEHDLSKLSASELVPYRAWFFPTELESAGDQKSAVLRKFDFDEAWSHHRSWNPHHWQTWTEYADMSQDRDPELNAVHMVIDWLAMSYTMWTANFGSGPRIYYETNKNEIPIPDWAEELIYDIFCRLETEEVFITPDEDQRVIRADSVVLQKS